MEVFLEFSLGVEMCVSLGNFCWIPVFTPFPKIYPSVLESIEKSGISICFLGIWTWNCLSLDQAEMEVDYLVLEIWIYMLWFSLEFPESKTSSVFFFNFF